MSRRAGPDRAAENRQTIKNLLKLEGNKVCADCKKNKHPRWASWNLGVFVCIRCSGIHRGMGTHVSRVKSVDLDAWTDEQLQSVLRWGNSRANKYWEAKLAAGHVPSEAKIENFIRTKYESKRWVMDGPIPDPTTLDAEGDDDMPLSIVQEKAKIERSASDRQRSISTFAQPSRRPAPTIDLFGDNPPASPADNPPTDDSAARIQPKSADANSGRQTRQGDSLLGLDFFGDASAAGPARPSSAASNPLGSTASSRPDLKQSILSLYSSVHTSQGQPTSHNRQPSLGAKSSQPTESQDAFGGLGDAFSSLNFASSNATSSPRQPTPSFSNTSAFAPSVPPKSTPSAPQLSSPPPLSGGGFFDSVPSKKPEQRKPQNFQQRQPSSDLNFAFAQPSAANPRTAAQLPQDLFAEDNFSEFPSPAPPPVPPPTKVSSPSSNSVFNLSAPSAAPAKAGSVPRPPALVSQNSSAMFDPWSSVHENDAWEAPEAAPATAPSRPKAPSVDIGKPPAHLTPNDMSREWAEPKPSFQKSAQAPSITADEDYGGWTSAPKKQTLAPTPSTTNGGLGAASDPFDNPWG